jgi:integrase
VTSRRSPGEGSISQRKNGRWQASLQINGQRTTVYGKTRREAAAKLRVLQSQAPAATVNLTLSKVTLNDLLDAWLETKAASVKPRTLADYRATCDRYLRPAIGALRLARMTPERIDRLLASYREHPRTAQKAYMRLSQALDLAVRWGWLANNPCDRVDAPRYRPERKSLWSLDELRRFLDGTREHWLGPLWNLLAYSGIRLGEALALTWDDVDLAAGHVVVGKTMQRIDGQWVLSEPKTRAGVRAITLPAEAQSALRRQAERRLATGGGTSIFAGENNHGILCHSTVEHAMRRECQRLGLPPLTPHGLRHMHASLLFTEGVSIPEVSQRLGHANPAITMSVYAHALGKDDSQVTKAIGRALAR